MHTADALAAGGLSKAAANLRQHGWQWLRDHQAAVLRVASAAGLDVSTEIKHDIHLQPLADLPAVDVVMPFWAGDSQWLRKGVLSLLRSRHVSVVLHVVADGCEFPDLPDDRRIRRYHTNGDWGPYHIANSLVRWGHCTAEWLAIQDADDISLPDRFWRQIAMLERDKADMISSAARNFLATGDNTATAIAKLKWQKVVRPGKVYDSVKRGHCVNPTRTMRRAFFETMHGFSDLLCSADFEFDNRCRWTDQSIIDDQTIVALRRVHGQSLSHGLVPIHSPARQKLLAIISDRQRRLQRSPTLQLAQSFGALHTAPPLSLGE